MMFALAAPLLAWASSTPSMYGVSMKSALAYLYGVELETGKLFGKKVPLCSMEPGPKTNPQQCPWSIELA